VKQVLTNPLQTQREIAKKEWIWLWTTNRHIKELEQTGTKDDRILWICDKDIEIVELCLKEITDKIKNKTEEIKARDLSAIAKESSARYSIFKWDITDKDWWLKSLKDLSTEELLKMYNELDNG